MKSLHQSRILEGSTSEFFLIRKILLKSQNVLLEIVKDHDRRGDYAGS
jgi:hypothetical protein